MNFYFFFSSLFSSRDCIALNVKGVLKLKFTNPIKIMAKSFLVIACVCYCTICMHLAVTILATTRMENEQSKLEVDGDGNVLSAIHTPHRQPNDEHTWTDRGRHRRMAQPARNQKHRFEFQEENDIPTESRRQKRHVGGQHNDDGIELNPNAHVFVRKLFQQFGNGEQETMNVTGFEQMLQHLGLYRMIEDFSHDKRKPKSHSDSRTTDTSHSTNTNETVNENNSEEKKKLDCEQSRQFNKFWFSFFFLLCSACPAYRCYEECLQLEKMPKLIVYKITIN